MTTNRSRPAIRRWWPACALLVAVCAFMGVDPVVVGQTAEELDISSKRYIVVNAATGEVLAQQNADERVAIASLTKVFTTIEALERGELDQLITTSESDLYDASSTLMGFGPNETFTLEDLLYGMMLPSGNDAAHAIARSLGATPGASQDEAYQNFIRMMNERVANMGLTDTKFVNPHGWGVEGHYSTARDIATFVMYALSYPTFKEIIGTSTYTTSQGGYVVSNTNKLLNSYSGLVGGKTGYDDDAGYCLVEVAERGGTTLITVTLDGVAPDIWYRDNEQLLDFGFDAESGASQEVRPDVELLSYRDPDAAGIIAFTQSGSSVGAPLNTGSQAQSPSLSALPGDVVGQNPSSNSDSAGGAESGDGSFRGSEGRSAILAVVGVAALIAAVTALKAFAPRILAATHASDE